MNLFEVLDPITVAMAIVGVIGIVPVVIQYRDRSKWFAVGYVFLVIAALATNLEDLFLGTLLNGVEHGVGLMGAGIAFLVAAYVHRRRVIDWGVIDDG